MLALLVSGNMLYGQENEKEALAKLSFMMGNWEGTSTVYGDTTKRVSVSEKVHYMLDGNLLVLEVNSSLIQLHTVISYSLKDGAYYYHPFSKRGGGTYKGEVKDQKFIVTFGEERRLVFERTDKGAFHEYGEKLVDNQWEKYFEDLLYPTSEK